MSVSGTNSVRVAVDSEQMDAVQRWAYAQEVPDRILGSANTSSESGLWEFLTPEYQMPAPCTKHKWHAVAEGYLGSISLPLKIRCAHCGAESVVEGGEDSMTCSTKKKARKGKK